jgi:ribonuclease-3
MLFRRRPEWLRIVEQRLDYRFSRPELIEMALTHRSHAHECTNDPTVNYERLEFLGDAMLGLVVSEWLYNDDPNAAEGTLTRRRQRVVRTSTLADTARRLGLDESTRLGRGEERTGGRNKTSLMADTFEAVLAAVYLDGGIKHSRTFVERHLAEVLRSTRSTTDAGDDYKTQLQERVQARLRHTPRYRIVSTSGPAHALRFQVEVLVADEVLGDGEGTNRKRAEQDAARQALEGFLSDEE